VHLWTTRNPNDHPSSDAGHDVESC
jgi:hypothetical protein